MGSVKDLLVTEPACENRPGIGSFVFSDRYSVFDWGEMPDHIAGKGKALAAMAAYHFEVLERRGIRTHYQGLVGPQGRLLRFNDLEEGSGGVQTMQVRLGRVYHPIAREFATGEGVEVRYDYSFFAANRGRINNYLIGLEIIFRNGLPLGSSVFKRLEEARARAGDGGTRGGGRGGVAAILRELGLKEEPVPGQMLPRPIMGFTTKLEPGDRALTEREALQISGLKGRDFADLRRTAFETNEIVTELAHRGGFEHYDGKIEAVWDNGIVVCDVLGTFDENRFAFQGQQLSKEVLRQWYKRNQPEFVEACDRWKKTGAGWQERCDVKPLSLPKELAVLASQMYAAGCNRYTGKRIFEAPPLEQVLESLSGYRG
ncbi:MAG: phosphoribosylaminoimidazolesuccinocarboxamide synthase [Spirochaetales bacterium]|nr:phosphoribosylaminoimidazolesuccinocarboxamide synthase [Spirochaetales bacterium]